MEVGFPSQVRPVDIREGAEQRPVWLYLTNNNSVPGGLVTMFLLAIAVPKYFPNHSVESKSEPVSIRRVDFLGVSLLLTAMTLHITGLEQAANLYGWTSAKVLVPLLMSAPLWIGFFASQWYLAKRREGNEAVFPWRFCTNRVFVGLIA